LLQRACDRVLQRGPSPQAAAIGLYCCRPSISMWPSAAL